MKALEDTDRINTYKIEAARFSYLMFQNAWDLLQTEVATVLALSDLNESKAVAISAAALAAVDHAMRFCNVLTQIKGMKRSEPGITAVYRIKKAIEDVRNHIQHIDQSAHKADARTYPILGAVSWPSADGRRSFTTSLGTVPEGTMFHTLSFDQELGRYVGGITLSVGKFDLELERIMPALQAGEDQLARWLAAKGHLSTNDLQPSSASMGPLLAPGRRFVRGNFIFTDTAPAGVHPEAGE